MDGHIQEHAARDAQEFHGGQVRVVADDLQQARAADLTRSDDLVHLLKALVKAAVEAHLQLDPGFLDDGQGLIDLVQLERQRFFAEDMLAGCGHILDDGRMRVGAGCDQDGFDRWVGQQFMIILDHPLDAELVGQGLGDFQAEIADRRQFRFRDMLGHVAHVHAAHASGADHGDLYFSCH